MCKKLYFETGQIISFKAKVSNFLLPDKPHNRIQYKGLSGEIVDLFSETLDELLVSLQHQVQIRLNYIPPPPRAELILGKIVGGGKEDYDWLHWLPTKGSCIIIDHIDGRRLFFPWKKSEKILKEGNSICINVIPYLQSQLIADFW